MNDRLYSRLKSGKEYLKKYKNFFDDCLLQYNNGHIQYVTYIEWYLFIETFIQSNKHTRDNFKQIFTEMSNNTGVLIDNSEYPEDQILLPYQILLKSLLC